jgi:phage terminase large subunit-like protein
VSDGFPHWLFDDSPIKDTFGYGERAVKFLRLLKHPKSRSRGKVFELPRFQERIIRRIYGPCHPDGRRIVRNVVVLLPRGNRKTSLAAAISLLHLFGPERVNGGQILMAAADQKQAKICFEEATGICREDSRIASKLTFRDYQNRLLHPKSGSIIEAISSDAGTKHGSTPSVVIADELHAWGLRGQELWDVLKTGLVKTPGTLSIVITTAGRGQENVAHSVIDHARRVARGEINDPATLPILLETPRDADWKDEAVWRRVNPGLMESPPFPDIEGLRQLAREAENRPADREAFKQLHLNVWLDHSADPFVDMATYDLGNAPVDLEVLKGEPCWLGVDLSSFDDLTAIVAAWRDGKGGYIVTPYFFTPKDGLRKKADKDGVPYPLWAEDGLIEATPGPVIDQSIVLEKVRELCDSYNVREIAVDPYRAQLFIQALLEEGLPAVSFRQSWQTMAPAVAELEKAIVAGKFQHGGHPVLRWNFDNIAVETDKALNRYFHKDKSRDRIDGAVASAMAVSRAATGEYQSFIYADANARPEGIIFFNG